MHAFRYGHLVRVDTEKLAPRSGTTTFVDGGSAGFLNFLAFREYVIKPSSVNILAFLSVSAVGLGKDGILGLGFQENDHPNMFHLKSSIETVEKNLEYIVGIKVRAYTGLKDTLALQKARELADAVNLPIMVHLAPPPLEFNQILPFLQEGDILTHIYHGGEGSLLDNNGKVKDEYWEAKNKGILMDVGLDRLHGDLNIMQAGLDQGFEPDFISTDLSTVNMRHITFDLPTTVSRFLALGMPLETALQKRTYAPANKLGKLDQIWVLQVGMDADLAIISLIEGEEQFEDIFGHSERGTCKIAPELTISKGKVLEPCDRETFTLDAVGIG
jgi:dihydroorotase